MITNKKLKVSIQNNLYILNKYIFFLASLMIIQSTYASISEEEDSTNYSLEKPIFSEFNEHPLANSYIYEINDSEDNPILTSGEQKPLIKLSSTQITTMEKANESATRTDIESYEFPKSEDVSLEEDFTHDVIPSTAPTLELLSLNSTSEKIKHNILVYIEKYLIEEQEIPENIIFKTTRRALKILLPTILGCTAGLTLLKPACQAAQGNSFLCIMFSGGTFIGLGGAAAWAGLSLVSQFDPISQEEVEILNYSNRHRFFKAVTTFLCSTVSSFPAVFAVYKYNTEKWLVIPALLSTITFKSLGFHELFSFFGTLYNQHISTNKRDGSDKINQEIDRRITPTLLGNKELNIDELKNFVRQNIQELLNHNDIDYLDLNDTDNPRTWRRGYPRKIAQFLSLIFPVGNVLVSVSLAYEALGLLFSSPLLRVPGAIIGVLPGFSLDVMATTLTVGEIFDTIYDKFKGNKQKSFVSSYYPITSKLIIILSLGISVCYATSGTYITYDVINNSTLFHSLKYILPAMVLGTNTIFGTYTNSTLWHDTIEASTTVCGPERNRVVVFVMKKLETFKKLITAYFFSPA